jgi:hypothetical protein
VSLGFDPDAEPKMFSFKPAPKPDPKKPAFGDKKFGDKKPGARKPGAKKAAGKKKSVGKMRPRKS